MSITLSPADWLLLLSHFLSLSLLAVGGAVSIAPEMHRLLVERQQWLSAEQFNGSIALAQAAPGPNAMYIALIGWNVGLNAAGADTLGLQAAAFGTAGVLVAMIGTLLPSCTLTYFVAQWGHRNRQRRSVRAFKSGVAPLIVALWIATSWVLTASHDQLEQDWPLWLVTVISALLVWKTRIHLLWLIGAGALLGGFGLLG